MTAVGIFALVASMLTLGATPASADSRPKWTFLLRNANTAGGSNITVKFGSPKSDVPIVGDWDGNGSSTVGVVRAQADGHLRWLLRNANTTGSVDVQFTYGSAQRNDFPVVGDWDGNGTVTIGVVRPDSTGHLHWLLRNSNSTGNPDVEIVYGSAKFDDFPVVGDWTGATKSTTIGVVRSDDSGHLHWLLRNTNTTGAPDLDYQYGSALRNDFPIAGDWDGNGSSTAGVVRADSSGHLQWLLRDANSLGPPDIQVAYGSAKLNDVPVAGNWDADSMHTATIGVVRPT